jgi:hypothetical protein
MEKEHAPDLARSAKEGLDQNSDAPLTSLTDLIDEMDRAAFRRSLASRDLGKRLEITSHNLQARDAPPKS